MLESMAGNMPRKLLSACYNSWASKSGYPPRPTAAINSKLSRCGISARAEGEWITSGYVAKVLGLKIDTPQRWADKGYIESYRGPTKFSTRYFRRLSFVEMAKAHPEFFSGIDRDRLFALLEDADLADSIASNYPRRKGSGRPIQVVETGVVFPSVCAAARAFYVRPQSIYFAMKRNSTCAGYHWRHVDPTQLPQLCQTVELGSLTQPQGSGQHWAQQNGSRRTNQS